MKLLVFLASAAFAGFFTTSPEDVCKDLSNKSERGECLTSIAKLKSASAIRQQMCEQMAKSKSPAFLLNCVNANLTATNEKRCQKLTNAGRYKAAHLCIKALDEVADENVDDLRFRECLTVTNFNDGKSDSLNDKSNFASCMEHVVTQKDTPASTTKPAPKVDFWK